jgi:molybdenum cofactor cytidylyltransferase
MGWLVLAAGRSTRFGADKLLATLANGNILIDQTLQAIPSGHPLTIVVRPDNTALRKHLGNRHEVLACPCADKGMGSVIAWSTGVLGQQEWIGILLADMPFILTATLQRLADAASAATLSGNSPPFVIAPFFNAKRGHPVIFSQAFYPLLHHLTGDTGARTLLATAPVRAALHSLQVTDSGILIDIDTPEALNRSV